MSGGFVICVFFFSSRRRHTRSKRDWSSDVCSSDLFLDFSAGIAVVSGGNYGDSGGEVQELVSIHVFNHHAAPALGYQRSEERRVGKEWRSRWARSAEKKKKKERETEDEVKRYMKRQ